MDKLKNLSNWEIIVLAFKKWFHQVENRFAHGVYLFWDVVFICALMFGSLWAFLAFGAIFLWFGEVVILPILGFILNDVLLGALTLVFNFFY